MNKLQLEKAMATNRVRAGSEYIFNPVDTYYLGNKRLEIIQDNDAQNPRTECDNLGVMVCGHRRYTLGDSEKVWSKYVNDNTQEEMESFLKRKDVIWLPLYLYDHSGITMKTTPFGDRWDSGLVGWIFVTNAKVREEYNVKKVSKKLREKVLSYLKAEVETYDQYLTGDTYGFQISEKVEGTEGITEEEWNEVDACWGFYGSDIKTNGILDHIADEWKAVLIPEKQAIMSSQEMADLQIRF